MRAAAFRAFCRLRDEFEERTREWAATAPWLAELQEELRETLGYGDYRVETPVVFNEALREVEASSEPVFVLVADNPGKMEQLARNRRYLVGQSGKLAEGWFRRELGIDFRKEVILINKTPLHTPKTAELRKLLVLADAKKPARRQALLELLNESQRWMATLARRLHETLGVPLWISGYGELGPRGLFAPYSEALALEYGKAPPSLRGGVLLFRHFSMNQFAIEMKEKRNPDLSLLSELERIGSDNRKRILGW